MVQRILAWLRGEDGGTVEVDAAIARLQLLRKEGDRAVEDLSAASDSTLEASQRLSQPEPASAP